MLKFRPYRLKCNALDYQGCEDSASGNRKGKNNSLFPLIPSMAGEGERGYKRLLYVMIIPIVVLAVSAVFLLSVGCVPMW